MYCILRNDVVVEQVARAARQDNSIVGPVPDDVVANYVVVYAANTRIGMDLIVTMIACQPIAINPVTVNDVVVSGEINPMLLIAIDVHVEDLDMMSVPTDGDTRAIRTVWHS